MPLLCALTARVLPGRAGVKRIKISINYRGHYTYRNVWESGKGRKAQYQVISLVCVWKLGSNLPNIEVMSVEADKGCNHEFTEQFYKGIREIWN